MGARKMSRLVTRTVVGVTFAAISCGALSACSPSVSNQAFSLSIASSLIPVQTSLAHSFATSVGLVPAVDAQGTATLVHQILEGKSTDLLLSADIASVEPLMQGGRVDGLPVALARNHLVLAVPADNPASVRNADDLGRPDVRVVYCAVSIPCGTLAHDVLARVNIHVAPITETQNVAEAVRMLESGEATAGFVYATDVLASRGALVTVADSRLLSATTTIVGVVIKGGAYAREAREMLTLWSSPEFVQVWIDAGFEPVDQK